MKGLRLFQVYVVRVYQAASSMQNASGTCGHPGVETAAADTTPIHQRALARHLCAGVPVVTVLGRKSASASRLFSNSRAALTATLVTYLASLGKTVRANKMS